MPPTGMWPWKWRSGVCPLNRALRHVERSIAIVHLDGSWRGQLNLVLIGHLEDRDRHMCLELLHVFERPMERSLNLRLAADVAGFIGRVEGENRLQRKHRRVSEASA